MTKMLKTAEAPAMQGPSGSFPLWVGGALLVIAAFAVPLAMDADGKASEQSLLHKLIDALHPWIAFGVLPLFAFANSGVSLAGMSLARLLEPIPLGIAAGLFIGKQIGIFSLSMVSIKLGICRMPEGTTWLHIYGASVLAGIGFTMSLFIGTLAFSDPAHATSVRLGVLTGSLLSAVLGYLVLRFAASKARSLEPARA